jgi:hypothetical protein
MDINGGSAMIRRRSRGIFFSSNRFEGKIPELVGSLKELHLLNLYYNALIGHIPSSLENLTIWN